MTHSNEILFQVATAIFAVTGVLAAARQNMDVLSFMVIGVVTALGGGTMRDVALGSGVFWLHDPTYLYVAAGAAVATFFFERIFRASYRALLYLDALGTAIFCIIAAAHTNALGYGLGVAVVMGVLTGVGGGMLRDLITGRPNLLTSHELFMTPILIGAVLYETAIHYGADRGWSAGLAMVLIAGVRTGAIRFGWSFPAWLIYRPAKA